MFEQRNSDQLKLLFDVFKRDPSTFKYIIDSMQPYVQARGEEIIRDEENLKDPNQFTFKLLALKQEIDEMVSYAFENGLQFQKSRD